MKSIVLTGGGTAGHIIPNLALIPELRKHFDKIYYIGGTKMEKNMAEEAGIPFYSVTTVRFERGIFFSNLKIPELLIKGTREAKTILTLLRPNVVFSKGGYVALPACFAAKKMGIPVVTHESDYSIGLANRVIIPFAKSSLTSFSETPNGIFVGNPIREEILNGSKKAAATRYGLSTQYPTILVVGGSLGSKAINDLIALSLEELLKNYNVVHIVGRGGEKLSAQARYVCLEYANDIYDLFAAADLVISRGGANTLNELACLGKKAIIIPLPKGASRGDQLENALSYQRRGFFSILRQEDATKDTLLKQIEASIKEPFLQKINAEEINKRIVEEIIKVI